MKHHRSLPLCLVLAAAFLSGCATSPGPDEPLDTTKYTIESTGKFVRLDQLTETAVVCTGLQERILPDGRLEVVANVKNLEKRRIQIQIDCVFADEKGISIGETPFRDLVLAGHSTEAVPFTSADSQARKYTIRVRETR